jgi:hypothetical protein
VEFGIGEKAVIIKAMFFTTEENEGTEKIKVLGESTVAINAMVLPRSKSEKV